MTGAAGPGGAPRRRARGGDERLRQIIDRLPDGIVIVGEDGRVRFANPAAQRLFGRGADELVGSELGFPAVVGETTEIDVLRRGGGTVVAELRVVHIEWEGALAFLVALRDVTDRREAEERRRQVEREQAARQRAEAEARRARFLAEVSAVISASLDYHATLEALARLAVPELGDWCVVDVVEEDGSLARIAAAHADPSREPLLLRLRERYPARFDGQSPAAVAVRSGDTVFMPRVEDGELDRITQDAEHAALVRALGLTSLLSVPLLARSDTLGAVTLARAGRAYAESDRAHAEDFAQRAAQSISNARLYREAQEASRAKSEFLAVMSHELRTPLNAVTGYADLLQAEVPGPVNDRQRDHLERITASARHLVQIIEEILAFSRMESGTEEAHPRRVDLRDLVRESAALLEPLARQKELRFTTDLPADAAPVDTDPAKVRQVLRNLISNAIKFTEEGSVRVEVLRQGAHYLVRVADTGIGISPEAAERVFEAFWQVEQSSRREVGGTGLGLSVARGLTELLGGALTLESVPGEGTTFTLALPAAD